ncbi:MAG: acylphosphatase [Nitrososphaerales archaeon]
MVFVRVRLVVEGEVQKVGYRDFVQRVARSLGIKGFVENLRDGNVQIVCETEKEVLENFIKKISVKEDFINVESVRIIETSPATGEFEYFDIKYGRLEEELGDRMVMAVNIAKATRKEIGEMRIDMNRNFEETAKRYDVISTTLNEAVNTMKVELLKTREELTRAVDNLSRLVQEFIKKKHKD